MRIKIKYIIYAAVIIAGVLIAVDLLAVWHSPSSKYLSAGEQAPNYSFQLENGTTSTVASYRGRPLLLWFVATWCDSCALGNVALSDNLAFFKEHNVSIVELEQYKDLGEPGMPISQFISKYANDTYIKGGTAGYNMTLAYNTPPNFQLDIYYLINPSGKILYVGEGIASGIAGLESMIDDYKL
ncbi:MAG: redoxin domain-containing protein [Candidatus Parvarchaeota archaeon]|nr:redoxin domain-containing protein [Candidatus Parvarchaeota archaeon]MCW1301805.1 redoxin domain-containing protein [Candidatus Parvarchaeota archaeon]